MVLAVCDVCEEWLELVAYGSRWISSKSLRFIFFDLTPDILFSSLDRIDSNFAWHLHKTTNIDLNIEWIVGRDSILVGLFTIPRDLGIPEQ